MIKKIILLILLFFSFLSYSQIGKNTEVFLATIAPGSELYSQFGHSVLVFKDDSTGLDRGYSYGTFDFNTPNFYWKFLTGSLPYSISVYPFSNESNFYLTIENRGISLQKLHLTEAQILQLYEKLENNLLPENKYYKYQFFYDNCSTRLKEMILSIDGIKIINGSYPILEGKSYRDWMNDYLTQNDWVTLGMNLALGMPSNTTANAAAATYIPDNLYLFIENLQNGSEKLVSETRELNPAVLSSNEDSFNWFGPMPILPIFLLLLLWAKFKKPSIFIQIRRVFYPLLLLLFGLIFFLTFFTDHQEMAWNPAVLLFLPMISAPYVKIKPIINYLHQILVFIAILAGIYEMTLFVPIIFLSGIIGVLSFKNHQKN